jgi:hypothetical protein
MTVTFNTTAGSLAAPAVAAALRANGSTEVVTATNADGVAQVTLTASNTVETATVSARVDTGGGTSVAPAPLTINFISGAPAGIDLRAIPATVGVGTTSTVLATVTDAGGVPIEGVTVTFSLQTNNSGASLFPTSVTTDADGEASVTYTAGTILSTDTIRASAPGASGNITATAEVSVQTTTVTADNLELLVSSPQLDSDGSETVTLTALVRDVNNNFVANVPVTFAASSGGIEVTTSTTDASGRATAILATAGDPTNRTIDLTASAGTLTDTNTVTVTGTTVTISGASTLVLGQQVTLSLLLRDSGGNGIPSKNITLSSELGNTLSATTVLTDSTGQAKVNVTAIVAGTDRIQASALGAVGTFTLTVSAANFVFNEPALNAEIPLEPVAGEFPQVEVLLRVGGIPTPDVLINFTTTRGIFDPTIVDPANPTCEGGATSTSAQTGPPNGVPPDSPPGIARVTICSINAGPAVITASCPSDPNRPNDPCTDTPTTQVEIEFVATNPTSLILQASSTTLGVNPAGSLDQQTIITAIVRDSRNNLVKNRTVDFSLSDVSGGSIFPASAITDSSGRASTIYTAGAVPSAQDGVIIDAQVVGIGDCDVTAPRPRPCDTVTLTVARQALFITLGTGNEIFESTPTNYQLPYKVIVTDVNSNPVSGVRVELNLIPLRFFKGNYVELLDPDTQAFIRWVTDPSAVCENEDLRTNDPTKDRNGILDGGEDLNGSGVLDPGEDLNGNGVLDPEEDRNGNGVLDPGNVATVPAFVTTGDNGIVEFVIDYPQDNANWVEVELEARTSVAGSESSARRTVILPVLAADVTNRDIAPPGFTSPFGASASCDDAL